MNANRPLSDYVSLTIAQKKALEKGGFGDDPSSILLIPPQDVAKKLRLPPQQVLDITEAIAKDLVPEIRTLDGAEEEKSFSTGDERIDAMLGGGICTGQIYDICGEASAGKTQLALQLALFVQLAAPHGVSGSAAYITTSSRLPTDRLLQIVAAHPTISISEQKPRLEHVHTSPCKTSDHLIHLLTYSLRALAESLSASERPLRLIIIDSLASLFHNSADKGGSAALFERSKVLAHIAFLLRGLARDFDLAVVVLNHVSAVFEAQPYQGLPSQSSASSSQGPVQDYSISYHEQARWFGSSGPGSRHEAALGLVWANEVNARLMLTRTQFRHYFDDEHGRPAKRRKTMDSDGIELDEGFARVRRMDVIFHPDAPPANIDFIITEAGISAVSIVELAKRRKPAPAAQQLQPPSNVVADDINGLSAEELALYAKALADDDAELDEIEGRQEEKEKGPDPDVTGIAEQDLAAVAERGDG